MVVAVWGEQAGEDDLSDGDGEGQQPAEDPGGGVGFAFEDAAAGVGGAHVGGRAFAELVGGGGPGGVQAGLGALQGFGFVPDAGVGGGGGGGRAWRVAG